jgi:hypothetical protein
MPAFTFEKISPPASHGSMTPVAKKITVAKKHRGVLAQMLDRFVEGRVKRTLREERTVIARRPGSPD